MKLVDHGEPTSFLDNVYLGCTQRDCTSLTNTEKCSNHEFLQQELKNYQGGKNFTQKRLRGPTIWKDILKNALRDIANRRTKRQTNCIVSTSCLDGHNFKNEVLETVGELSNICSQSS